MSSQEFSVRSQYIGYDLQNAHSVSEEKKVRAEMWFRPVNHKPYRSVSMEKFLRSIKSRMIDSVFIVSNSISLSAYVKSEKQISLSGHMNLGI